MDYKKEVNKCYDALDIIAKFESGDSLEQKDGAKFYINDLLQYGCQSGMVNGLIYYVDTKAFYIKFIEEIDELREEMEEMTGEPLKVGIPSYNWLAWFGYEETMRKIADKLGLEF